MHIGRCGDRRGREEPRIVSTGLHRSPAPRDLSSLQFSVGASVGPEALAAGSEPGRWLGGHAPDSRRSLAQQMVAHRRCTKEPMAASLCQEVGSMTRVWARAWSAAGGFLQDSAALGPQEARAAQGLPRRQSVGGKR